MNDSYVWHDVWSLAFASCYTSRDILAWDTRVGRKSLFSSSSSPIFKLLSSVENLRQRGASNWKSWFVQRFLENQSFCISSISHLRVESVEFCSVSSDAWLTLLEFLAQYCTGLHGNTLDFLDFILCGVDRSSDEIHQLIHCRHGSLVFHGLG